MADRMSAPLVGVAQLVHRHVFGYKANVSGGVSFMDEDVVAFPAGHNIVIHSAKSNQQRFISANSKSEVITAMAMSPNHRFVAVAERAEQAQVNVYDVRTLKRRKRLATTDVEATSYVSVAFSSDARLLLTMGDAPDWKLVCWMWEKGKVMAMVQVSPSPAAQISLCSFNPVDLSMCCVTGDTILRFYRIIDGEFKAMPALLGGRPAQWYTAHAWLVDRPDSVVVGTDAGELLLLTGGELVSVLPTSPGEGAAVRALLPYSKGFVCGGDRGALLLFEPAEDEREGYVRTKRFQLPSADASVTSLALSPSEEVLCLGCSDQQLLKLRLADAERVREAEAQFEHLVAPLHARLGDSASIDSMDVCVRKPLVATCGSDRTVRLWNYAQRTLEVSKEFADEVTSVAFHPSGLHLLVGFADKLRLMNILIDDIREVAALPIKGCRAAAFSNGGHLFAAVGGNSIHVISTYTCQQVALLRGHNARVHSLHWLPGDAHLVSSGSDGAVYLWEARTGKRDGEYVNKSCKFLCAHGAPSATQRGADVFAVADDSTIKRIDFPGAGGIASVDREFGVGNVLSQIVLSHASQLCFAAVGELRRPGALRSYRYPVTRDEYRDVVATAGPVNVLRLSHDDQFAFAAGRDGTLFVFEVQEAEGRAHRAREVGAPFSEEILVTRTDLEERAATMSELTNKVSELRSQTDYQVHIKEMEHSEHIKDVTDKYMQQVEQDKNRYELLREEKTDMEMEFDETVKQMEERHQHTLQQMEAQYQQRIMEEVERYQQLVQERDVMQEREDQAQRAMIEEHKQVISEVTERFEAQLTEARGVRLSMQEEMQGAQNRHGMWQEQLEDDIDAEVQDMCTKYERKLQHERNMMLGFRGENGLMKKRFASLQKEIEDQRELLREMLEKDRELVQHIQVLKRDIDKHKDAVHERDATIGEKERRIYELKKRNQELEKFKFVLDHKIKALKQKIDPRDNEIQDMKEQIKEMDADLEDYHKCNAQLDLMIGELRAKLDSMQTHVKQLRQRAGHQDATVRQVRAELHECVQHIQEPRELREAVTRLYKRHVRDSVSAEAVDVDIQREYARQREFLEMSVASLKQKLRRDSALHSADNMRIMQENMALIRETQALREELRGLRQQQQQLKVGDAAGPAAAAAATGGAGGGAGGVSADTRAVMDAQRSEIGWLRERIREVEESMRLHRPASRERLPPMDGQ